MDGAGGDSEVMDSSRNKMVDKSCKKCSLILAPENRAGRRLMCKPCRVEQTTEYRKNNLERCRERVNRWTRKTGRVKEYPCEICSKMCYKKYARAFCSDKCRFFSHVEVTATCWLWKGGRNRRGYGKTCLGGNSNATAHRVAYELFKAPIPEDKHVLHTCDNPSCVNPAHLWIGTTQDNKADQIRKDRGGMKLKAEDVIEIRRLNLQGMGSQAIAYLYKVACSTISNIIKRRVWKHI